MNPQKKRIEQLKKRKENAEMAERQQMAHNSKSKKKPSKEPANIEQETDVRMSAENVDYEYSAEEDYEDEEYKSTKNETIKKLLIHKFKLEKSIKLAKENEKKLSSVIEQSGKWFNKYENMLEEIETQLSAYDKKHQETVKKQDGNVGPLCERWKSAHKTMESVKISAHGPPVSASLFGNLVHYAVSILRQLLFYMAYCRDLIPRLHSKPISHSNTPPNSDSPRTNSLRISISNHK